MCATDSFISFDSDIAFLRSLAILHNWILSEIRMKLIGFQFSLTLDWEKNSVNQSSMLPENSTNCVFSGISHKNTSFPGVFQKIVPFLADMLVLACLMWKSPENGIYHQNPLNITPLWFTWKRYWGEQKPLIPSTLQVPIDRRKKTHIPLVCGTCRTLADIKFRLKHSHNFNVHLLPMHSLYIHGIYDV